MTIEEAKKLKKETEIAIEKLLRDFVSQTHLKVEGISMINEDLFMSNQIVMLNLHVKL